MVCGDVEIFLARRRHLLADIAETGADAVLAVIGEGITKQQLVELAKGMV